MNLLAQQICREIAETGPMAFSRFMELALYAQNLGYYEKQAEIGRRGDFYTSVSVGNLFGSLLARQFSDWLGQGSERVQLVEVGAHRGQLAGDILSWLREREPQLYSRLEYWLIEPSSVRRGWQETTLKDFTPQVRWCEDVCQFSGQGINGILFSNELLDAMPVHRLRWNGISRTWDEWMVGFDPTGDRFTWVAGQISGVAAAVAPQIPPELAMVFPDGFTVEVSPAAADWWREAARALKRGVLLTFDYGLTREEFLMPERRDGTLRAYSGHRVSGELLEDPGEQDITAHVDLSTVQQAGEREGLETVRLTSQRSFLTEIFEGVAARPERFRAWTPAALRQFQTLTHPEHLGRAFRVLIQRRP